MIEVKGFAYGDGQLGAHVHLTGRQCASYSFHDVETENPALHRALEEVERCIVGAIIINSKAIADESVPESAEVDMALCKVCLDPVLLNDPRVRRNGPFVYCYKHA